MIGELKESELEQHTTERVWALLLVALAVTDREVPQGVPREEWLNMCAHVYDQSRGALAEGVPS